MVIAMKSLARMLPTTLVEGAWIRAAIVCSLCITLAACGAASPGSKRPRAESHKSPPLVPVSKLGPAPSVLSAVLPSQSLFPGGWASSAPSASSTDPEAQAIEELAACLTAKAPSTLPMVSNVFAMVPGGLSSINSSATSAHPLQAMQAEAWLWPSASETASFFKALRSPAAPGCVTKASSHSSVSSTGSASVPYLKSITLSGIDVPAVAFAFSLDSGSPPAGSGTAGGAATSSSAPAGSTPAVTLPASLPKLDLEVVYVMVGRVLLASDWYAVDLGIPAQVLTSVVNAEAAAARRLG